MSEKTRVARPPRQVTTDPVPTAAVLGAADVTRIHQVAMGQLIPAIHNGLPYSGLLLHACWLSYEVGLIADDRIAAAPRALQEFSRQIRDPGVLDRLPLARPWRRHVTDLINAVHDAKDVDNVKLSVAELNQPAITNALEQFLADLLPGFTIASAETTIAASSEGDGGGHTVDWGEVVEEDVKGAVIGGVSGFAAIGVVAVLGGPVGGAATAGATAGAAVVGGLLGSGVKYLEEDAVRDGGIATTQSDGNNPWVPGEGGDGDGGGRWHDGDGYGFG